MSPGCPPVSVREAELPCLRVSVGWPRVVGARWHPSGQPGDPRVGVGVGALRWLWHIRGRVTLGGEAGVTAVRSCGAGAEPTEQDGERLVLTRWSCVFVEGVGCALVGSRPPGVSVLRSPGRWRPRSAPPGPARPGCEPRGSVGCRRRLLVPGWGAREPELQTGGGSTAERGLRRRLGHAGPERFGAERL